MRQFSGFLLILMLTSCGGGGSHAKLYTVRGKAMYGDKPMEGASVVFVPVDDSMTRPTGVVDADGQFTLKTHPHGDGAPAGDYVVLITWYEGNARSDNPKNRIDPKYGDPGASPLRATVKTESTTLEPFVIR